MSKKSFYERARERCEGCPPPELKPCPDCLNELHGEELERWKRIAKDNQMIASRVDDCENAFEVISALREQIIARDRILAARDETLTDMGRNAIDLIRTNADSHDELEEAKKDN